MNICVIGTGYVGLVTGVVFADLGNDVICVDKDEKKIELLKAGKSPIYEPGVEELIERGIEEGRLVFSTDINESIKRSEVVFIAVGTPSLPSGESDLSQVEEVAKSIALSLNGYKIIVNKSTVPVGSGNNVRDLILKYRNGKNDFDVVSNPEFLREGQAVYDTLHPDRIVIGATNHSAALKIVELYAPLERPMLMTDLASAELIKYASNCFLALKISYINALSQLCESVNADIALVAKGMGADSRIGPSFLQAGLGYGGSCLPKDVAALIATSQRFGCDASMLKAVQVINTEQPKHFVDKIKKALGGLDGKTIAVLGLSFKPNTDDLREAKSIEIIRYLLSEKALVKAYDPAAMENFKRFHPTITYANSPYDAAQDADAVVLITEWNEFKQLNLDRLRSVVKQPYLFDGRNIYDPTRVRRSGFCYEGVGRAHNGEAIE
ncbi:MAG: UDP-glucose/GDP-mannose dehydrogenase family protein [bacterium]